MHLAKVHKTMPEQDNNSAKRENNSERYNYEPIGKNWKDFRLIVYAAIGGLAVSAIIKSLFG